MPHSPQQVVYVPGRIEDQKHALRTVTVELSDVPCLNILLAQYVLRCEAEATYCDITGQHLHMTENAKVTPNAIPCLSPVILVAALLPAIR